MLKQLAIATVLVLVISPTANAGSIIINGDFESGNTGFSTDYCQGVGNGGCYEVVNDPHAAFDPFASFGDHTSGAGLMMVVNGATSAKQSVWKQTVPVIPNTDYEFTAWVASIFPLDPARVQFRIGDDVLGNILAPSQTGIWQPFAADWNSGASIEAVISIFDLNLASNGNDFALDDIQLVPEPSTLVLLCAGLLALGRRKQHVSRAA